MSQASFQKRMREKARADKARAKRERREQRAVEAAEAAEAPADDAVSVVPQEKVLADLERLHERFDEDRIDFEEFEQRKSELLAQLDI